MNNKFIYLQQKWEANPYCGEGVGEGCWESNTIRKMTSIKYSIILVLLIGCQDSYKKEIASNKEAAEEKEMDLMEPEEFGESDSLFLKMVNNEIVIKEEEKKYISNIEKLKSVKLIHCDSMSISYKDTVEGKHIEFFLSLKKFKKQHHKIKYWVHPEHEYQFCESIDGKEPWGGYYGHPKTEIDKLEILIDGNNLEIKGEFQDLFNFEMCDSDYRKYFNPNPLLKYDKENQVFYLYVKGGGSADTYFGKFVFNEKKFIKRYLLHYGQLSETASFKEDFKGF